MKKNIKLLIFTTFFILSSLLCFYLSNSFYYHNMRSFLEIDLLKHDEYYHAIKGEYSTHEIDLKVFSLKTPESFRYIELSGDDAFVGYIANNDINIYFHLGNIEHPGVPLTIEESFEKYGQQRENNLYIIKIDSVENEYESITRKIAKSKKRPIEMWLELTIKPKNLKNCNYEYYLTMIILGIDKNNEDTILKIFKSIKINNIMLCPPMP